MSAKIEYPGKRSIFAHQEGDWSYQHQYSNDKDALLRREIGFLATNSDGSIRSFKLFGDKDGSLRMHVTLDKLDQVTIEFFAKRGFKPLDSNQKIYEDMGLKYPNKNKFEVSNSVKLKELFQIINDNNFIPKEYKKQLSMIIAEGKHSVAEEGTVKIPEPQYTKREKEILNDYEEMVILGNLMITNKFNI